MGRLEVYSGDSIEAEGMPEGGRDLAVYEAYLDFDREGLEGKDILDLGAGPEVKLAKQLKELGIDANVVELSPDFLEKKHQGKARKSFKEANLVAALGEQLPFKSESFDEVFALYVAAWMGYQSAIEMFKEIARVLKEGGTARIAPFNTYYDISDEAWKNINKSLKEFNVTVKERLNIDTNDVLVLLEKSKANQASNRTREKV